MLAEFPPENSQLSDRSIAFFRVGGRVVQQIAELNPYTGYRIAFKRSPSHLDGLEQTHLPGKL